MAAAVERLAIQQKYARIGVEYKVAELRWHLVRRILITGIPGARKTTIGARIAERYGFEHVELEREAHAEAFLRSA